MINCKLHINYCVMCRCITPFDTFNLFSLLIIKLWYCNQLFMFAHAYLRIHMYCCILGYECIFTIGWDFNVWMSRSIIKWIIALSLVVFIKVLLLITHWCAALTTLNALQFKLRILWLVTCDCYCRLLCAISILLCFVSPVETVICLYL